MTPHRILLAIGLIAAVTAGAVLLPSGTPDLAAQPAPPDQPLRPAPAVMVGSSSCSAAACHGGDTLPGGEHLTVLESDPHRTAFAVLFQERSVRMVRLLAKGQPHPPAHQTDLCLRCHGAAPPNQASPLPPTDDRHRTATCENCHGAASNWLTTHYTRTWKAMTDGQKAAHGLAPTKNLAYRSQVCAGCHVGEPGREVNHQLIAAGHPALRFELAAYHAEPLYTKHWTEKGYGPDVEAWLWAIGQVGTARASADLLRHRAADSTRDWPELAEYTCFSCHQDLTGTLASVDRSKRQDPLRSGQLPWGSWSYPLVREMAGGSAGPWCRPGGEASGLGELAATFRKTDQPDRAGTARQADRVVSGLDRWLADLQTNARRSQADPLTSQELGSTLRSLIRFAREVPRTGTASTDWDRTTQAYLAVAALYRARCAVDPATRDPGVESELQAIAAGLRFPQTRDAPQFMSADEFQRLWAALAVRFEPGGRP